MVGMIMGVAGVVDATAQSDTALLRQALEKDGLQNRLGLQKPADVKLFYQHHGYRLAFISNRPALQQLFDCLHNAASEGLTEEDYQYRYITAFRSGNVWLHSAADSLQADFRFADAAIHFLQELVTGNKAPDIGYNGLHAIPAGTSVAYLLSAALLSGSFVHLPNDIEIKTPEYTAVKNMLLQYLTMTKDTAFRENRKGVPVAVRILELKRTLNTIRWLQGIKQQGIYTIVVNIPSANVLVYKGNEVVLESKAIVGKTATRTPTLGSWVNEVVLYPYWMVPHKIATKELLPLIKKNIHYLDANNLQVMNQSGRVVNPRNIDWQALSASYFPYTLRQSTGCDNSLGIIKLNFYSPYTVYLHDTPWKSLFLLNRRYFSHGCIRVEKAVELAQLLLGDNRMAVDTLVEKGCLYNQKPVPVPLMEKAPVVVLYNTAWFDSTATVRFYSDVYGRRSSWK
jgi:murein L,D-transpeptidase YcbB/YkuD